MNVLMLGINYAPEPVGIAIYTTGMAQALAAAGHDVRVVTAQPYYPDWRVAEGYRSRRARRSVENGVAVTRVPLYVPARPSGARRLAHHASFAASAATAIRRATKGAPPDLVMVIAPSLMSLPVAIRAARRAGCPLWAHLQDFEVDAAEATGLLKAGGRAAATGHAVERRLLRAADRVTSISPQMCLRLAAKGVDPDRIGELRNWAEIDLITPSGGPSPYAARWNIDDRKVALYSGNIANKQGIEIIVEAARLLRDRRDLVFVICGQGPNRERLAMLAQGLDNVQLHDLQPREALGDLLGLATVHLLPQIPDAADLVLPSKMANMLASGRPVVATAAPGTGIAEEVDGCGLVCPPGDAAALAAAVAALIDDPARGDRLGGAGRARAVARWSRSAILARFVADVERLSG